jgi:hypothetical protein
VFADALECFKGRTATARLKREHANIELPDIVERTALGTDSAWNGWRSRIGARVATCG